MFQARGKVIKKTLASKKQEIISAQPKTNNTRCTFNSITLSVEREKKNQNFYNPNANCNAMWFDQF